ncbi:MAG: hypothetical protein IS860_10565 [Nitrosopumilus sp.]|nr:hypothetical protein [Nitrosopumilus sp.]
MNQKLLKQAADKYRKAKNKAMNSRDKRLVKELSRLEKEYDEKIDRLEKKADKTMDPVLKKEWKQARKEYEKVSDMIFEKFS